MESKSTVLVVEDDTKLRTTVMDYLSSNGFEVLEAEDGLKAIEVFKKHSPDIDIILLDGMLPMLDGLEVLKHIREESDVPVIMISARETETDQLQGFYTGADNYITKPFLLSVLREQISALLSRTQKSEKLIERGALKIDTKLHRVYIDGSEISTTPKEYDLLL